MQVQKVTSKVDKFVQAAKKLQKQTKNSFDQAHYFEGTQSLEEIKQLLESNSDKEKMDGMKQLIAVF
jgi:vesicle coat complex subunit